MASLGQRFDATSVDTTQRDNTPFPGGIYNLECIESDVVDNSEGTGKVAKLTHRVIDGPFEGRRMWVTINVTHNSPAAQEIGQKELASLCRAIGIPDVEDTEELHYKKFTAEVKIEPASKNKKTGKEYGPKNTIKRYYFPDEGNVPEAKVAANDNAAPPTPAPKPAAAAPSAASTGKARPWAKK